MKKYLLLGLILTAVNASAQRFIDDIYFTPKDAQQEQARPKGQVKNGAREVVFVNTAEELQLPDTLEGLNETTSAMTTDSAVVYVAEGSYPNGFEGTMEDFEYTQRIYRFHNPRIAIHISDPAYNDIYFLDDDLWNVYIDPYNYAYVTPTWTNPYYWDYMYRPYAYGSWAWRWNPYGAWGWNSCWGWHTHYGWDPYWGYTGYWDYYNPYWGYPHWGHHHHHHHVYPSHGHHTVRLAFNQEGERRREEGVRLGQQIDRRSAIMGGSAAGNRVSNNTVISSPSNQRGSATSNTRRVTSGNASANTHRVGTSTSVRPSTSQRPVSTQRRVSTIAHTGSSEVRRTTATQHSGSNGPSRHSSATAAGRTTYTSGGNRSVTTSRGQVSTGSTTSGRSSYSPQHSGSRSASGASSYRSSSPSRSSSSYRSGSSSTSYRSSSSSSRSSSSYSSSHSSSSSHSGGRSSGGGRR